VVWRRLSRGSRETDMERPVKLPLTLLLMIFDPGAKRTAAGGSVARRLITLIFVDRVRALAIMVVDSSGATLRLGVAGRCQSAAAEFPARVLLYREAAAAAVYLRLARSASEVFEDQLNRLGAAVRGYCRSISTPIDQIKPSSSRPTAVTTCCLDLPRAIKRL
jgi:hypothetical protein